MIAALACLFPFEPVTLGERVSAELREFLINGEFTPGEKLSLRVAANAVGVSIMPVLEAVAPLVTDEALESSRTGPSRCRTCLHDRSAHPAATRACIDVAFELMRRGVPFVTVMGSNPTDMPAVMSSAPRLTKPDSMERLPMLLRALLQTAPI